MTPRRRRMLTVGLIVAGVALAVGLALRAFQENLLFFYTPTQTLAGQAPVDRKFRLGGMVEEGSLVREPGSMELRFTVADNENTMIVSYSGVLPDLFRDGQGVIAIGHLQPDGIFRAEEVLARHDENYMPPEVAEALAQQGHPPTMPPAGRSDAVKADATLLN